jgi:Fic family protein
LTPPILACAEELGAARAVIALLPLPLSLERALRQRTRLSIAHHSTWIENRTLAIEDAAAAIAAKTLRDPTRARNQAALEVRNYYQALDLIEGAAGGAADERFMRRLHATIMRGRASGRPKAESPYRTTNVRVGNFVYVPPAFEDVPRLMRDLADWACGPGRSLPGYLFAAILAYQFVTIHPFEDGNGRTCRALATWALRATGCDAKGLLNVEEFYVQDLAGYYEALQMGLHYSYYDANARGSRSDPDLTPWLEYFCVTLGRAARAMRESVEARFREAHPEALADPLAQVPAHFRRILGRLSSEDELLVPGEVALWLSVSDKTVRSWLKEWKEAGHVEPASEGAKRVRAYRLSASWRSFLGFPAAE